MNRMKLALKLMQTSFESQTYEIKFKRLKQFLLP